MALWRGIGARKDASRGTSPIEVRKTVAALFARPGVLPGGASPLLTGNATWAYNVGIANFVTSRGASDGDQLYGNDGVALIGATGVGSTVPIAPGAGLSRIDIAWTRHPANTENADTSSEPLFGVASGVAASSNPVAPSIPAGAIEIGRNLMTNAATSTLSAGNTITQSALYTALRGAPVWCRNQAERDAYGAAVGLSDGLEVYLLDTHVTETYNGTAWSSDVAAIGVQATKNATQAISGGITTAIAFPTENWDSSAFHDLVTNNSRLTIPAGLGGKYLVTAKAGAVTGTTPGLSALYVYKNGANTLGLDVNTLAAQGSVKGAGTLVLAAGDYIEAFVFFTTTSTLDGATGACYLDRKSVV